ncbi:MAG: toprim domain-containing protein [Caldilineaceae bacterium]
MSGVDLLALIGRDTVLRRTGSQKGGEYSSPCPLCRTGDDRFKVWPYAARGEGRWACLGPAAGRSGCDKGGDAVQYLRERDGLSFAEACVRLGVVATQQGEVRKGEGTRSGGGNDRREGGVGKGEGTRSGGGNDRREGGVVPAGPCAPTIMSPVLPPSSAWQERAAYHAARCAAHLWGDEGAKPRAYLHNRGLFDGVLRACEVGYNPEDVYEERSLWGLAENGHKIWLPRGITFPWRIGSGVWRLNIRRPLTPSQAAAGEAKYIGPAGYGSALYNADALAYDRPAVLVEGEIDAITIAQACPTEVAAVATGSTAGGRRPEWIARLAQASVVLLAFDVDPNGAGDQAAAWWQARLPRARRLRPLDHDVNSLPEIETVRAWLTRALARDL